MFSENINTDRSVQVGGESTVFQQDGSGNLLVALAADAVIQRISAQSGDLATGSIVDLATLLSRIATLGQKAMSGSAPVAFASDQSPLSVQGFPGMSAVVVYGGGGNFDGVLLLGGSSATEKDDTFYGDGITSGIASVARRDFNGTSYDRVRTPTAFKTALATANGDTAVWTPSAGKKFRIMAYSIEVTSNAAAAAGGVIEVILRDATTALGMGISVFVPAVAGTIFGTGFESGWRILGNGKLSATADNILNVNLSAALTAGEVRVNAIGTEE